MPRILAVDDDEQNLGLLVDVCAIEGITVDTARDGEACVRLCATHKPEAILMDLMMPGQSGLQVLEHLQAIGELAPVLFVTACADRHLERKAFIEGAIDYITKPFHVDVL